MAFLLLNVSDWVISNKFGLLNWLPKLPIWINVLIGILSLDLIGAYLPHWLEHKIKPLWMIHLVHHSDPMLTQQANRHHPLESLIRFIFTLIGVLIIGVNIGIVMLYQTISLISTQFNHANIKLPKKLIYFWLFFVSPDMPATITIVFPTLIQTLKYFQYGIVYLEPISL